MKTIVKSPYSCLVKTARQEIELEEETEIKLPFALQDDEDEDDGEYIRW